MSKGFRKSLFGFNTTDVLAFIAASDKAAKLKTDELNAKISELESKVKTLEEQNLELVAKNAEYESKKEQIRVMSENVARMYLSAKTTSQLLVEKAEESRRLIAEENKEQLSTLQKTNESMLTAGEQISSAAESYCEGLKELCASLEAIKSEIDKNEKDTEEAIREFSDIVNKKI
ncbi:MAG: hypothetical protein IJ946_03750 [Clostridia bacterium]|nr:hypothetical protein [Clostridia bacterium]